MRGSDVVLFCRGAGGSEPATVGEGDREPEDEGFVAGQGREGVERLAIEEAGCDSEAEEGERFWFPVVAGDGHGTVEEECHEEGEGGGSGLAVVVEGGDPDGMRMVCGPAHFCGGGIRGEPAFAEETFFRIGEAREDDSVEVDASGVPAVDPAAESVLGKAFEARVRWQGRDQLGLGIGAGLFGAPCEGGGDAMKGGRAADGDDEGNPGAAPSARDQKGGEAGCRCEGGSAALAAAHGKRENADADGPAEPTARRLGGHVAGGCPDRGKAPCDPGGNRVLTAVDEPVAEALPEVGSAIDAPEDDEADDCRDDGDADADAPRRFHPLVVRGRRRCADEEDEEGGDVAEGLQVLPASLQVSGCDGEDKKCGEPSGGREDGATGLELAGGITVVEQKNREQEDPEPDFVDDARREAPPSSEEERDAAVAQQDAGSAAPGRFSWPRRVGRRSKHGIVHGGSVGAGPGGKVQDRVSSEVTG